MKCFYPYFRSFTNAIGESVFLPLPCGRCESCRAQNASVWTLRLQFESGFWQSMAFVTLTYSPEHCPSDYNLDYNAISLFMKRLRRRLDYKIKFYGVGEYGSQRGRPHYHLVIFGLHPKDFHYVESAWRYGFSKVERVLSNGALAYVSQYVQKKIGNLKQVSEHYCGRRPPYMRCSQGLGLRIIDSFPCFTRIVRIGGHVKWLGRYLIGKLAQKFNCVESSVESSLDLLESRMRDVIDFARTRISPQELALLDCIPRLLAETSYSLFIAPYRADFLARLKLKKERLNL